MRAIGAHLLRASRAAILVIAVGAAGWWLLGRTGLDGDWIEIDRRDLALTVDVTGTLKAVETTQLGPPGIPDVWEYKISFLAPEGAEVKEGQPVLGFDTSDLDRTLMEVGAIRDAAAKKIEQKRSDSTLRQRQDELRLVEAEAKLRKAAMKAETPDDLVASADLRRVRLDLEQATLEVEHLKEQLTMSRAATEAAIAGLEDEYRHAQTEVGRITEAIGSMTASAPRDGTIIYIAGWREEKKKVGDSCWLSEKVLEIPDLKVMMAEGEVDEAEAGGLAAGQEVLMKLDAHADVEFAGRLKTIAKTVQKQRGPAPLKVVRVEIELRRTDPERMRPGMRFRGTIRTHVVGGALVIPEEAVFSTPDGPIAYRRSLFGFRIATLSLGRRNAEHVELLGGLREKDQVSRLDLRKSGDR